MTTRRQWFRLSAAAAAALAARSSRGASFGEPGIKITFPAGGLRDESLRFMQQLGVRWITAGGPNAPTYSPEGRVTLRDGDVDTARGPWKDAELQALKDKAESYGLRIGNLMLHDFRDVILGRPRRDEQIEHVIESIRAAGRVGVPVVEYNWYALRAMGGYYQREGRGGTTLAAHDYDRAKDLPPLPDVGEHSAEELWARYEYFLEAVVPEAERAGVYLAVHPNDPPPPVFRGCAQILGTVGGLMRVADTVQSPHNGITFDTGVTTEMGEDLMAVIRWFGERQQINHVHFRNVIREVPRLRYTETFIDVGQADMASALRTLKEVGYDKLLHPDHTPRFPGRDRIERRLGLCDRLHEGVAEDDLSQRRSLAAVSLVEQSIDAVGDFANLPAGIGARATPVAVALAGGAQRIRDFEDRHHEPPVGAQRDQPDEQECDEGEKHGGPSSGLGQSAGFAVGLMQRLAVDFSQALERAQHAFAGRLIAAQGGFRVGGDRPQQRALFGFGHVRLGASAGCEKGLAGAAPGSVTPADRGQHLLDRRQRLHVLLRHLRDGRPHARQQRNRAERGGELQR